MKQKSFLSRFRLGAIMLLLTMGIGQLWATDYTIYEATSSGVDCANATKTGVSVTFNSMKGVSNSPITSVENTTYGIAAGLKAPRWGGSGDGKNIAIVVAENYTATVTAYVQVNTANPTVTIKQTSESGENVASVSCSATETVYQVQATDLAAGTYYIKANDKVGLIKLVASVTATGGSGGGEEPGDDPDPDTPTTGTIEDLVTIDGEFTFVPTAELTTNTLYEGKKIISLGGSGYKNNGVQIKTSRQLAFKVAAGAKIVVTFTENSGRIMQIGTTSAGTDLASSASSPVTAIRSAAGIVYISASSDLYLTRLEISYPTFYTVTYDYNGGTLKEGESDLTESAKEAGETFTVASAAVLDAPEGKVFDKWNDGSADYAPNATYTVGTANVTLTAQWRNASTKYAVTYDLGDYTAGVAPTEVNRAEGEVFAIKAAPSWTDHDFLGWLCNIDAATYQAADNYTMTDAATTFTAQWQAFFTITYKDGEETLDTEKVNAGSEPIGISAPAKELKKFLGWTLVGGSDLVNLASLTENTVLVAKWGDFDGCAYLAVDLEETATLSVGDNVALKASSFGGSVKVAGMKSSTSIAYNGYGLYLSGGGADSLQVTIGHQLQEGSKITVALRCTGTGVRGLKLLTNAGAEVAALGWTSGEANAEGTFTYEVPENSALIGEKNFRLQRNNTVYLKYIEVEECAPQDYTVTYKDGETTLGTEYVFENAHPTAAGISTHKNGYAFQGWAETAEGAVVELNSITITGEKTLYAKYTARDCSGAGTKFKFQLKTNLTSGNVFAQVPNSEQATTDNYLAELTGGAVEFAVTGSNNNRLQFYDQKAVGFTNNSDGKITIALDCPLLEGDEIRFINYASSGNSITLSDGTNSTTLDGNKAETVQTFTVPAAWETTGSYELTMVRNQGTAKLTYFEIYRHPALTSVTLEDMTIRVNQDLAPHVTLTPIEGKVTSQTWAITARTGAADATIDENTGDITTGSETGTLTVQATYNGSIVATCTVTIINVYESLVPVTETTTWNWNGAASDETKINDAANLGVILANYINGANFEKLEGIEGNYEYAYRNNSYPGFQGTQLHLVTTVPGMLTITARNSGSGQRVYVNNHEVTTSDLTSTPTDYMIAVPAGDVTITSSTGQNMRIYSMTFDTNLSAYALTDNVLNGYTRELQPGTLSTTCLPNGGVIVGASAFEIAYMDYESDGVTPHKIYFDEVVNGEMEAGVPYIVLADEGSTQMGVFYTDSENKTAQSKNGLVGYMGATRALAANDYFIYNNMFYYVSTIDAASGRIKISDNRAYINLSQVPGYSNEPVNAPAPGRRRIAMGNGNNAPQVATAVDNTQAGNVQCTKVLIDGELFILRGEKMYDATGRLVK